MQIDRTVELLTQKRISNNFKLPVMQQRLYFMNTIALVGLQKRFNYFSRKPKLYVLEIDVLLLFNGLKISRLNR